MLQYLAVTSTCLVLDVDSHSNLGSLFEVGGVKQAAEGKLCILLDVLLVQNIHCALVVQPDL